ncbi:MAG: AsmA-like C-terminal region-containing protein [Chitinophagales bacterium]
MRFIKLFLTFIIFALILFVATATFFEEKVENFLIQQINNNLSTELIIKGDIGFSFISDFPYASLTLNKVAIRESLPNSKRNLLETEEMAFLLNWGDVFANSYRIQKMVIRNGELNMRSLQGGQINYDILKEDDSVNTAPDTADDEDMMLSLQQTELYNIAVHYMDEPLDQEFTFTVTDGTFAGDFGVTESTFDAKANIESKQFYIGDTDYLPNKKARLNLQMGIDWNKELYTFEKSSLDIEGNVFEMDGTLQFFKGYSNYDLALKGVDLEFAQLLNMMPNEYKSSLEGLSSKGNMVFDAAVKGKYSPYQQPQVNVNFELRKGTVSHEQLDYPLKNMSMKGSFTNGASQNQRSSVLNIENVSFDLAGELLQAYAKISNFEKPQINASFDGLVKLKAFRPMASEAGLDKLDGGLEVNQMKMSGDLESFYNYSSNYPTLQGKLKANDVSFKYNNHWVDEIVGDMVMNNGNLQLDKLQINLNKSDLQINGTLERFAPLVFQGAMKDSIVLTRPVKADLDLTSEFISMDELLEFRTMGEVDSTQTDESVYISSDRQDYIVGRIRPNIQKLRREELTIENIEGALTFNNSEFIIEQILMKMAEGQVDLRGDFSVSKKQGLVVKLGMDAQGIDVQELLTEMDNFGQTMMTDDNIKGTLSTKMHLKAYFNKNLELDMPKLLMAADIVVEDGELIDFEPMMSLSSFVKVSELERVRFARLENQIQIAHQKMRIPTMFINSNVTRITFSGLHTFENRILYYVRVNLLDLLFGKFKKKNKEIKTDKNPKGGINLHVVMQGDAFDPDIKYMKKKVVKQQFENDSKRSKTDIGKILEEEFAVGRGTIPAFAPRTFQYDDSDVRVIQWSEVTEIEQ